MYSKLDFCSELLYLITQKKDNRHIVSWADDRYLDYYEELKDEKLLNMLDDLRYIDEPEFEISRKEMIQMCIDLLNEYLQEINED